MQRLLYLIIYPFLWGTSLLPLSILYIKSNVLYVIAYHIIGYRKKVVMQNLSLTFPSETEATKRKIAKQFYKHLCDLIFESIKSLTISEAAMRKRFQVENINILTPYYEKGQSIFLMAGHYANWEWSGILTTMFDYEGIAVYKPLDNPYFDRLVKRTRSRFGPTVVTNKAIVPMLFRKKKKGETTLSYILSDQTPKRDAYKHRDLFMGIDVPVFTGTEELAKKLDFPVFYLQVHKRKRGYYTSKLIPLTDKPKELPNYAITRKFLDALENQIRETPQYYLWSHKRWKHRA
ncbi:MAG: lysophospholipid acyltransferase family protein [Flavobacteriales bacterium]|jgi:KDO2-lipid IV(A) lauroyltransferase|nr:lysophospholipid acyltransferase family protein [Flavobacteriales bacterium]